MPEITDSRNGPCEADAAQPCGPGRRLLVMVYDAIALIALMMAVMALLLMTPLRDQTAFVDFMPTAILCVTWFLYLAWCWRRGLTLGMRAWRVKIEFQGEHQAGWRRYGIRFLVSLVSAACLGLGFVWSLFNPQHLTWHDIASHSRLIRTPK